jgi:hypothetical protein
VWCAHVVCGARAGVSVLMRVPLCHILALPCVPTGRPHPTFSRYSHFCPSEPRHNRYRLWNGATKCDRKQQWLLLCNREQKQLLQCNREQQWLLLCNREQQRLLQCNRKQQRLREKGIGGEDDSMRLCACLERKMCVVCVTDSYCGRFCSVCVCTASVVSVVSALSALFELSVVVVPVVSVVPALSVVPVVCGVSTTMPQPLLSAVKQVAPPG